MSSVLWKPGVVDRVVETGARGRERAGVMGNDHRSAVLNTYRYLRLATIVIVLMLGVAVSGQLFWARCWQTSVSAYYWTSAHSVFVAALCAIGACLIVYKGSSDTEDIVLNFSGFLAFIVAMVPTTREPICGGPGLPPGYEIAAGVRNNVWAVLVAGVVAEVASVVIARKERRPALNVWAKGSRFGGWIVIGVGAVSFVFNPQQFEAKGHNIAAVTMFVGIIFVVLVNAYWSQHAHNSKLYVKAYGVVAVSMIATLIVVVVLSLFLPQWDHAVVLVEVLLILEFATFWGFQTAELWKVIDRRELIEKKRVAATL
jgi:hypothetical protein